MDLEDFRKQKDAKFLADHELDDDALERLIENKFKRARAYHEAFNRRTDEVVDFD